MNIWETSKISKNHSRKVIVFSLLLLSFSLILVLGKDLMSQLAFTYALNPEIIILSPQNTTYTTTSVELIFTVSEKTSWMGYSLDFQENVTITGNVTLTELAEGPHNIIVFANDTSGFMGASQRVYFTVSPVHNIAVANVSLPFSKIVSGEAIPINVTVANKGTIPESFNVTIYHNGTLIEAKSVYELTEGSNVTLIYIWNTSLVLPGVYLIKAEASVVPGEIDVEDNLLIYGKVTIYPKPIVEIKPSFLQFKMEEDFEIGVWIVNVTNLSHFEFSLRYNSSLLYIEEVIVCDEYGMFLKGPYSSGTIYNDAKNGKLAVSLSQSSEASPVNGSGQLANIKIRIIKTVIYSWDPNSTKYLYCELNLSSFQIGVKLEGFRLLEKRKGEVVVYGGEYLFTPVPGDLNLDGVTDAIDLCACGRNFGETGKSIFDVNGDMSVDEKDLFLVAVNIGRSKP